MVTVSTWSHRRRVDLTQVERKKMTFSTAWVLPVGRIPKRYPGWAGSWAELLGQLGGLR
jgi:hypothetical protein